MSWGQQWGGASWPQNVINPTPDPVSASALTPEQWATYQQQNWQQWIQWQQQYQTWQHQYGQEYQKSMNALTSQPPIPVASQSQPPLPPIDNTPPLPPNQSNVQSQPPLPPVPPEQPQVAATPQMVPPVVNFNVPPPNMAQKNQKIQQKFQPNPNYGKSISANSGNLDKKSYRTGQFNKNFGSNNDPKKIDPPIQNENPNFSNFDLSKTSSVSASVPKGPLEGPNKSKEWTTCDHESIKLMELIDELVEAEKVFDKQFEDWEAQFNRWKEQNVQHPDKEQYRQYEQKWENWRKQLLDRREQMRKRKSSLMASLQKNKSGMKPTSEKVYDELATKAVTEIVEEVKIDPVVLDWEDDNAQDSVPNFESTAPKEQRPNRRRTSCVEVPENSNSFLNSSTNTEEGIPGLDLVKSEEPKPNEETAANLDQKTDVPVTDFEALSKGINQILGDPNLINMLSSMKNNKIFETEKNLEKPKLGSTDPGFNNQNWPNIDFNKPPPDFENKNPNFGSQNPSFGSQNANPGGVNPNFAGPNRFDSQNKDLKDPNKKFEVPNPNFGSSNPSFENQYNNPHNQFGGNQKNLEDPNQNFVGKNPNFGSAQNSNAPRPLMSIPPPNFITQKNVGGPNHDHDNFGGQNRNIGGQNRSFGPQNPSSEVQNTNFGRPNSNFAGTNKFEGENNTLEGQKSKFDGPNSNYGGPISNLGGPNPKLGGPNSNFGGPNKFGGSNTNLDVQKSSFDEQKPGFGGPNPNLGGPNSNFGGPNNFGGQNPSFGNQNQRFPNQNQNLRNQNMNFANQNPYFRPQNPKFRGPNANFDGQETSFGGPNSKFEGQKYQNQNWNNPNYYEDEEEDIENMDDPFPDEPEQENNCFPASHENKWNSNKRPYQENTPFHSEHQNMIDSSNWDESLIFKPVTVIDYAHKSLNRLEDKLFIEPVQTFDYGHTSKKVEKPKTDDYREVYDKPHYRDANKDSPKPNLRYEKDSNIVETSNYEKHRERSYRPGPSYDRDRERDRTPHEAENKYRDDKKYQDKYYDYDRKRYDEKSRYDDKKRYDNYEDRLYSKEKSRSPNYSRRETARNRSRSPLSRRGTNSSSRPNLEKEKNLWNKEKMMNQPIIDMLIDSNTEKESPVTLIDDLLLPPDRNNRPPRLIIIMRGPPGSGKTFLAKLIKDKEVEMGGSAPRILSLDDYFMVENEEEVIEEGRKIKKKKMVYEYEEGMENAYRQSLEKAFKKTITDGYFQFIILDCVNEKVKHFSEMWSFAKQNGFQVYISQMELDLANCTRRNIHFRSEIEIDALIKNWELTPSHFLRLDCTSLIQSGCIPTVEMTIEIDSSEDNFDSSDNEDEGSQGQHISKWEKMEHTDKQLAQLDGTNKPLRHSSKTMEDYLQWEDQPDQPDKPGIKKVRWADLEERRKQEKMRAIGFVVGQTDWHRMMDPTQGGSALTQTKYIERHTTFNRRY